MTGRLQSFNRAANTLLFRLYSDHEVSSTAEPVLVMISRELLEAKPSVLERPQTHQV